MYERTYSRPLPDGTKETWPQTVRRVAHGNLALVHGNDSDTWGRDVWDEYDALVEHIESFKLLPAGRHLWATGVKGRQYLMNCWTAGWTDRMSEHFEFTFMRLMEGGGVGSNYANHYLTQYGNVRRELRVHIVCDPSHDDYKAMLEAGVLSSEYTSDWDGAFEVEDSREGWASALVDLIDTYMTDGEVKHQNRVYDVTNVRPAGARLKTFGGTASGPSPFGVMMRTIADVMNYSWLNPITPIQAMEIDHAIAECVVSGGSRRSARMAQLPWDDPYIFQFIKCKADTDKHWTTNISVEIDDRFTANLEGYGRDKTSPNDTVARAVAVHEAVVEGMLLNGEPGYWNSSLSNKGELQPVYATNPCGEITLQPFEACNLGHVNLDAFAPEPGGWTFDEGGLIRAHELMTRFLIRATFADINDPKSREIQDRNRRIGVGHLGVQGFINKSGHRFTDVAIHSATPGYNMFRGILTRMYAAVRNTARTYAFELRIPEPVKVTTVAPTGSVAKLPGVTEGIHPVYARFYEQRIRFNLNDTDQWNTYMQANLDGLVTEIDQYDKSGATGIVVYPTKNLLVQQIEDMGINPRVVEDASEISLDAMLSFQAMYQSYWADNAVSFTVNIAPDADVSKAAETIRRWLPALKGTTVFPDSSRPQQPLTRISELDYELATMRVEGMVDDGVDLDCATGACPIR